MPSSFFLSGARCTLPVDPSLRQEILDRTGCDRATSNILRSIERFGGDASIQRFEIVPRTESYAPRSRPVAWSVRAVRT